MTRHGTYATHTCDCGHVGVCGVACSRFVTVNVTVAGSVCIAMARNMRESIATINDMVRHRAQPQLHTRTTSGARRRDTSARAAADRCDWSCPRFEFACACVVCCVVWMCLGEGTLTEYDAAHEVKKQYEGAWVHNQQQGQGVVRRQHTGSKQADQRDVCKRVLDRVRGTSMIVCSVSVLFSVSFRASCAWSCCVFARYVRSERVAPPTVASPSRWMPSLMRRQEQSCKQRTRTIKECITGTTSNTTKAQTTQHDTAQRDRCRETGGVYETSCNMCMSVLCLRDQ